MKLCTILVYTSGYRPEKTLAHFRTLFSLPLILGADKEVDADYLNSCRSKRNSVEYDCIGGVTSADADELIEFVEELKEEVFVWVKTNYPQYMDDMDV